MPNKCSVLLVGSMNVVFLHSYALEFARAGYEVSVLDIGQTNVDSSFLGEYAIKVVKWHAFTSGETLTTSQKIKNSVRRLLRKIGLERSPLLIEAYQALFERGRGDVPRHLGAMLEQMAPEFIFYFWSTTVRDKKDVLDAFFSRSCSAGRPKSVLGVNTYPVREDFSYADPPCMSAADRDYFAGFDLVLLANSYMQDLFTRMGYDKANTYIHDDRLSPRYFAKIRTQLLIDGKNIRRLCFLGNTNFTERTIDDVRWQLNKLAECGFEVSIQQPRVTSGLDARITYFRPYSYSQMLSGEFAAFLSGFDAVFMGYNGLINARSTVSMPTRFALGTIGFLPILIESDSFSGVREIFGEMFPLVLFDDFHNIPTAINSFSFTGAKDPYGDYEKKFYCKFNQLLEKITEC